MRVPAAHLGLEIARDLVRVELPPLLAEHQLPGEMQHEVGERVVAHGPRVLRRGGSGRISAPLPPGLRYPQGMGAQWKHKGRTENAAAKDSNKS